MKFDDIKKQIKNEKERKIEWVDDILKKEVREQPFILDKMIPENAITALTSDTGKGKSLIALKMAQAIAQGTELFDTYETKKKKILILDLEMNEFDITQRVHRVIQKSIGKNIAFYNDGIRIDDANDYKWLVDIITKEKFELVIFDTLNSAHGKEENSASEMREVNSQLLKLIKDTNITILYLHHHRKLQNGESYGQASSRGSTEILAKVASHLLLDSQRITVVGEDGAGLNGLHMTITQHKARQTESLTSFGVDMWYNPFDKKTYWKHMGEIEDKVSKLNNAKKSVMKLLSMYGKKYQKEISDALIAEDFSPRTIFSALKELKESGKVNATKGEKSRIYLDIVDEK